MQWLACQKSYCQFANQDERKFEMHLSCNSFSLSGVQGYQDLSIASQMLLTKFKLHQSAMQVTHIKMPPIYKFYVSKVFF